MVGASKLFSQAPSASEKGVEIQASREHNVVGASKRFSETLCASENGVEILLRRENNAVGAREHNVVGARGTMWLE